MLTWGMDGFADDLAVNGQGHRTGFGRRIKGEDACAQRVISAQEELNEKRQNLGFAFSGLLRTKRGLFSQALQDGLLDFGHVTDTLDLDVARRIGFTGLGPGLVVTNQR